MEEALRELNAKAYTMTIKEDEVLSQQLDEQLKAGLIKESKSRYIALCFYIKEEWILMFYQEKITSTPWKTIKMCRCLRMKCGQEDKSQQKSR